MVNWVRTIEMLDSISGDRKMTIKFHDREVNEDLVKKGEF